MIQRLASLAGLTARQLLSIAFVSIALIVAGYTVWQFTSSDMPAAAHYSTYICTETRRSFEHENVVGETPPIYSPYSKKNTGVRAEACFWTKDGKPKSEPTWVLLNELAGVPGPTFCPDCGRLVVGHNPAAHEGAKLPPTQTEYLARKVSATSESR